ncbi:MAG TPA: ABC transporter permease subunit, partial [Deltaproteobacteria bacterium]|nr:ABC transporter permease subunit [Deltaproteobacteria bacterium]
MVRSFRGLWHDQGGCREVLVLALPLVLSTSSWAVQHFVDRMFLTWYAPEAIAAAMPAGILNFAVMSFFIGTAGYVSTFVAQYTGAGMNERVGPALWQGLYFSCIGGAVLAALVAPADAIFSWVGHEKAVRENEVYYFRYLCAGAFPAIASSALSGLFTGLGRISKNKLINGTASLYVEVIRGIPLLVPLFYIYYALAKFVHVPDIASAVIAMAVCYGAYMGEIFRAGIQSIPKGQMEA